MRLGLRAGAQCAWTSGWQQVAAGQPGKNKTENASTWLMLNQAGRWLTISAGHLTCQSWLGINFGSVEVRTAYLMPPIMECANAADGVVPGSVYTRKACMVQRFKNFACDKVNKHSFKHFLADFCFVYAGSQQMLSSASCLACSKELATLNKGMQDVWPSFDTCNAQRWLSQ